jgi:hypothetical protein
MNRDLGNYRGSLRSDLMNRDRFFCLPLGALISTLVSAISIELLRFRGHRILNGATVPILGENSRLHRHSFDRETFRWCNGILFRALVKPFDCLPHSDNNHPPDTKDIRI